jgi:hypothetical protein
VRRRGAQICVTYLDGLSVLDRGDCRPERDNRIRVALLHRGGQLDTKCRAGVLGRVRTAWHLRLTRW